MRRLAMQQVVAALLVVACSSKQPQSPGSAAPAASGVGGVGTSGAGASGMSASQSPGIDAGRASLPSAMTRAGGAGGAGAMAGAGGSAVGGCDAPGLTWKTGARSTFTSYPDPGSAECIQYSGCMYEGQFAACDGTKPQSWVMAHDIVAVFPDFTSLQLHDLCLRVGGTSMRVTVLDTCADTDCSGCCTRNKGSADELIDVESFTAMRLGGGDGRIEWADLGPTRGSGCQ